MRLTPNHRHHGRLATINASAAEWAAMALGGHAYVLDGEHAYRIERAG